MQIFCVFACFDNDSSFGCLSYLFSVIWWSKSSWAKSRNLDAGNIEHPTDVTIFVLSFNPCSPYCFCMSQTRFGSCWIRSLQIHSICQYILVAWIIRKNWWKWGKIDLTVYKDRTRSRRYYHVTWILCDILNWWGILVHLNCSHIKVMCSIS